MAHENGAPADLWDLFDKYAEGVKTIVEGAQADTGQTPKEVIWTKNKAKLYHYQSQAEKKHPVPVLLIYALVNRSYILDLIPGNSFVEYLLDEGFDVYMLDWGVPGREDKDLSFENYVLDYMPRAVKKVLRNSGAEEFTLFGYCMGGPWPPCTLPSFRQAPQELGPARGAHRLRAGSRTSTGCGSARNIRTPTSLWKLSVTCQRLWPTRGPPRSGPWTTTSAPT